MLAPGPSRSSLKNTPHVVSAVKSARLWLSAAASSVMMMYSHRGGSSFVHSFHHSRLTTLASSDVGFCWYWAFHWNTGIDAFVLYSASRSKNSGHSGFSTTVCAPSTSFLISMIAGNSTTSYWSALSFCAMSRVTRPVRSSWCQRVCTIATRPPGIRRVRAP